MITQSLITRLFFFKEWIKLQRVNQIKSGSLNYQVSFTSDIKIIFFKFPKKISLSKKKSVQTEDCIFFFYWSHETLTFWKMFYFSLQTCTFEKMQCNKKGNYFALFTSCFLACKISRDRIMQCRDKKNCVSRTEKKTKNFWKLLLKY